MKHNTSLESSGRLEEASILPWMGLVADAYGNSVDDSFVSPLKREIIHRH